MFVEHSRNSHEECAKMIDDGVFIDMVRSQKLIWDGSKGNKELKEQIWVTISEALGTPVEECMAFWNSIRAKYTRERRHLKIRGPNYKEKWIYFDKLSFLNDVAKPRRNFKKEMQESLQLNLCDDDDYSSEMTIDEGNSRDPTQIKSNMPIVISNVEVVSPKKTAFGVGVDTCESSLPHFEFLLPVMDSSANSNNITRKIEAPKMGSRESHDTSNVEDYTLDELSELAYISPQLLHLSGLKPSDLTRDLSKSLATSSDVYKSTPKSSVNSAVTRTLDLTRDLSESFATSSKNVARNVSRSTPTSTINSATTRTSDMHTIQATSFTESSKYVSTNLSKSNQTPTINSAINSTKILSRVYFNKNKKNRKDITPFDGISVESESDEIHDGLDFSTKRKTMDKNNVRKLVNSGNVPNVDVLECRAETLFADNRMRLADDCGDLEEIPCKSSYNVIPTTAESMSSRKVPPARGAVQESSTGMISSSQKRATKPVVSQMDWIKKVQAQKDPSTSSHTTVEDALNNINRVVDELGKADEAPDTTFDGMGKYIAGTLKKMTVQQSTYLENRILTAILETRNLFNVDNVDENI